jgi:hypothetical protein
MNSIARIARTLGFGVLAAALFLPGLAEAQAGPYQFFAVTPCRAYDTRNGSTLPLGVIGVGEVRAFKLKEVCGIPADATAVSLNLTVIQPTGFGDLRIAPYNAGALVDPNSFFPNVSTSNYTYLENLANGAIVPLTVSPQPPDNYDFMVIGGMCCAAPPLQYHLAIDVTGYFK